jgi:heptosyltransferase-2
MDMVRMIGIQPESINPEIFLSDEEKINVSKFRQNVDASKKIIGINTTSGGSTANLSVEEYSRLIKKLVSMEKVQVVVTDYNVPKQIDSIDGVIYAVKNTSLRKLINIAAGLDVLISASTGPMHIAASLKIPTLSVFCPLPACSPQLWGPLGNQSEIILPEKNYCSIICPGDPKKCSFEGNDGIDHNTILNSLIKMFPDIV